VRSASTSAPRIAESTLSWSFSRSTPWCPAGRPATARSL
jgi:hypothetical protein